MLQLLPTRLLCPWDSPGKNTGVGCHALLQRIFPTQGLNLGLLHCRQILSHMSCKEVPPTFEVDAKTYPRTESPGSAGQETSISGLLSSRSRKSRGTRGQQKPRIKPGHEATSPRLADRPSGFGNYPGACCVCAFSTEFWKAFPLTTGSLRTGATFALGGFLLWNLGCVCALRCVCWPCSLTPLLPAHSCLSS